MASSQQQQQQQQNNQQQSSRRRHLTEEATSHGPYLWSGTDIENALLWFPSPPTHNAITTTSSQQQQQDNETAAFTTSVAEEGGGDNDRCEFLRSLLHSRGIWNPRPQKRSKSSSSNNYRNKVDNKDNTKTKRKRKRKDSSSNNVINNNTGGIEASKSSTNNESSPPLQSVLMGYYQLTMEEDGGNDNGITAATSTLEASTKLYSDLSSIISSRLHTHEIYRASLHYVAAENTDAAEATTTLSSQPHQTQKGDIGQKSNSRRMAIKIDQYMVHPTTCARRVYAASIYDRLLNLATTTDNESNRAGGSNSNEQEVINSKVVQKYVQKLFGLATSDNNYKIQEVILLLVLEPQRRLQVRQMIRKSEEEEKKRLKDDSSDVPQQQQQEQVLIELFPLITSQMVEDGDANNESSSPLITLLVKSILHTNLDGWWSQPSPLLCTISQLHFPIACKYLHYWINRAIDAHERLYQDTTTIAMVSPLKTATTTNQETVEETMSFQHAIERIQHFHQTSHRLRSLVSHVIHSLEEEMMSPPSSASIDEDEESEVFCRALALKAIKRALED